MATSDRARGVAQRKLVEEPPSEPAAGPDGPPVDPPSASHPADPPERPVAPRLPEIPRTPSETLLRARQVRWLRAREGLPPAADDPAREA